MKGNWLLVINYQLFGQGDLLLWALHRWNQLASRIPQRWCVHSVSACSTVTCDFLISNSKVCKIWQRKETTACLSIHLSSCFLGCFFWSEGHKSKAFWSVWDSIHYNFSWEKKLMSNTIWSCIYNTLEKVRSLFTGRVTKGKVPSTTWPYCEKCSNKPFSVV